MGYVMTKDLVPGMITATDVYNYNDQLVIPANTELTDALITRLEDYAIYRIRVISAEMASTALTNESYSQKVIQSPAFKEFKKNFTENVETLQSAMQNVATTDSAVDKNLLLEQTTTLINPAATTIEIFDMIHNMRLYDDSTFAHCINVSLICRVMAKWLNWSEEDTETLTLAGLLHDIGKLSMPDSILKKPGKLTLDEYAMVQTHAVRGYEILRNQPLNEHIKNAALMHHERCDGTGYPNGYFSSDIDEFAKVVAIADVYDAMTASRAYRGPQCPFDVIANFESEGLQKYDPHYILTFLERTVSSYLNNNVRMSDGRIGEVIMINPTNLSKPMVRIGDEYIDLSHQSSLSIESVV